MTARKKSALYFILLLGVVSLFSDLTHEGARSIIGPYLGMLGASAAVISFVSGMGEMAGYSLRLVTGFISDRTKKYWSMTIIGYCLNLFAIPLLALVPEKGWIYVCGSVFFDSQCYGNTHTGCFDHRKKNVDNLRTHRGKLLQARLKENKSKIELFYLPAYSPDLNPDEHLNSDVKYGVGHKAPKKTKEELTKAENTQMCLLNRTPERIMKYFEDPAIRYASL